jgi:LPS export ABC transporter protein LptC
MRNVVFLLSGCLLLSSCGGDVPQQREPSTTAKQSPLILQNIVLTDTDRRGKNQLWEIKAKRAEYSRDRSSAVIRDVQAVFFQNGRKVMTVKAPRGEVRTVAREIFLFDGVRALLTENATTLTASSIQWSPEKDFLECTGPVELDQPKQKIHATGKRLEGKLSANIFSLLGDVEATSVNEGIKVNAPRLVWNLPRKLIDGDQGVVARSEAKQIVVTAPLATWDLGKQQVAARAENGTPVVAEQKPQSTWMQANQMTWNFSQQVFVGQGNLQARFGKPAHHFTASQATYNLATSQMQARGARYWREGETLSVISPNMSADLRNNSVKTSGGVTSRFVPNR